VVMAVSKKQEVGWLEADGVVNKELVSRVGVVSKEVDNRVGDFSRPVDSQVGVANKAACRVDSKDGATKDKDNNKGKGWYTYKMTF